MFELIKIGERTYCIESPSKIGIYLLNETEVGLVDSGNDSDAGRKVLQILNDNGWTLKWIVNTHSHADHIGGNAYLQKHTGCQVFAKGKELPFVKYPVLEPTFLFGGEPIPELKNKFLMARPCQVSDIDELELPRGLKIVSLPGHSPDMIGVITPDNVCFLGDCVVGERTIQKYHLTYLHDLKSYFETLDAVKLIDASCFVPSHAEVFSEIGSLVEINRGKTIEILNLIRSICTQSVSFDDLLKTIFDHYSLRMDAIQYGTVGVTTRSYLSYLRTIREIDYQPVDNKMLWKTVANIQQA